MKRVLLSIAFFLCLAANTHAQDYAWAKNMGPNTKGNAIVLDGSGNVYTTGSFQGTVDFDPSATGTHNLTAAGENDVFVTKFNASGQFVWAVRMGGDKTDLGNAIAVDGLGNVYTTGNFQGTADFDPGANAYNLSSYIEAATGISSIDVFVSKLDATGNFVWAAQMGGVRADLPSSIAVDGLGNVYTTGYFASFADFDPGAGSYILNTTNVADNDGTNCHHRRKRGALPK